MLRLTALDRVSRSHEGGHAAHEVAPPHAYVHSDLDTHCECWPIQAKYVAAVESGLLGPEHDDGTGTRVAVRALLAKVHGSVLSRKLHAAWRRLTVRQRMRSAVPPSDEIDFDAAPTPRVPGSAAALGVGAAEHSAAELSPGGWLASVGDVLSDVVDGTIRGAASIVAFPNRIRNARRLTVPPDTMPQFPVMELITIILTITHVGIIATVTAQVRTHAATCAYCQRVVTRGLWAGWPRGPSRLH
jgi:hypothetical protein